MGPSTQNPLCGSGALKCPLGSVGSAGSEAPRNPSQGRVGLHEHAGHTPWCSSEGTESPWYPSSPLIVTSPEESSTPRRLKLELRTDGISDLPISMQLGNQRRRCSSPGVSLDASGYVQGMSGLEQQRFGDRQDSWGRDLTLALLLTSQGLGSTPDILEAHFHHLRDHGSDLMALKTPLGSHDHFCTFQQLKAFYSVPGS